MSAKRFILRWIVSAISLGWILFVFTLVFAPSSNERYGLLVVATTLLCYQTRVEILKYSFSTKDRLDKVADQLWSENWRKVSNAMSILNLTCGCKFVSTYPIMYFFRFRDYRSKQAELWRQWWLDNGELLVWDDLLEIYIAGLSPQRPPGTRGV